MSELTDKIKALEEQKQKLVAEESIIMRKAFESDDPDALIKAQQFIQKLNHGKDKTKSYFLDPSDFTARGGYLSEPGSITDTTLRRMANAPIIKAIIETRVEQVSAFLEPQTDKYSTGFVIRKKAQYFNQDDEEKVTEKDKRTIELLTEFILNCGSDNNKWTGDDFESWGRKVVKDTLILDKVASEIVRNNKGLPIEYVAVDAATIRLADHRSEDMKGSKKILGELPSHVQIYQDQIVAEFYPWEMMWGIRNPQTNIRYNGYGESELETLISTITAMLQGDAYNANVFKVGAAPNGIFRISGNINESRLHEFRQQWYGTMAGYANCLSGDSVLWTKEYGNSNIHTILDGREEERVNIWVGDSYKEALVYKTGNKETYATKLNNGSYIKTSPDHKFLVINEKTSEPEWKKQSELSVGDYVLTNKKPIDTNEKIFYKGRELEEDIFELMGWLTGDGHINRGVNKLKKGSLYYHPQKEQHILQRHLNILRKYGINANIININRSQEEIDKIKSKYGFFSVSESFNYIIIADADFIEYLFDIGFRPSTYGKRVPYSMFMVSSKNRCAFLRGLFSADGSMNKNLPYLSISHDDLRYDVRNLLLSEGIRCSLFEGDSRGGRFTEKVTKGGYRLVIKDRIEFFEKIGFIQEYKDNITKDIVYSFRNAPKSLMIKFLTEAKAAVWEGKNRVADILWNKEQNAAATRLVNKKEKGRNMSHTKFMEILDAASPVYKYPDWLKDYNLEEVVSIKKLDDEFMYDVEVFGDDRHQFIADGVVVHNSKKTAFIEADKMEFVDLSKSNRDMEYSKYQEYLIKLACAIFKISPEEIGFSIQQSSDSNSLFESNNESKLKYSRDKGLKPLLKFLQKLINKYIISPIAPEYEFAFVGLESETEEKELEMTIKKAGSFKTLKEIRRERGLPDEIDEDDVVLNPVYIQWKQMQMMGNPQSNEFIDEEYGNDNPFAQDNPMAKSFNQFVDKELIVK